MILYESPLPVFAQKKLHIRHHLPADEHDGPADEAGNANDQNEKEPNLQQEDDSRHSFLSTKGSAGQLRFMGWTASAQR